MHAFKGSKISSSIKNLASPSTSTITMISDNNSYIKIVDRNKLEQAIAKLDAKLKSVWRDRSRKDIEAIWDSEPLLQEWCLGIPINTGTAAQPKIEKIHIKDLIEIFRKLLPIRSYKMINAIWQAKENEDFRGWFRGKDITYYVDGQTDPIVIHSDLYNNFIMALNKVKSLIHFIWVNNPKLLALAKGEKAEDLLMEVLKNTNSKRFNQEYVNNLEDVDLLKRVLTHLEALKKTKPVKAKKPRQNATCIEKSIEILENRINMLSNSKQVNNNNVAQPTLTSETDNFDELSSPRSNDNHIETENFSANIPNIIEKSNLPKRLERSIDYFLKLIEEEDSQQALLRWDRSLILRHLFFGIEFELRKSNAGTYKASIEFLTDLFKAILSAPETFKVLIQRIWTGNSRLRYWCEGKSEYNISSDSKRISTKDSILIFFAILKTGNVEMIRAIWNENERIRPWFWGIELNLNSQSNDLPNKITLPLSLEAYTLLVKADCSEIASQLLKFNKMLRENQHYQQIEGIEEAILTSDERLNEHARVEEEENHTLNQSMEVEADEISLPANPAVPDMQIFPSCTNGEVTPLEENAISTQPMEVERQEISTNPVIAQFDTLLPPENAKQILKEFKTALDLDDDTFSQFLLFQFIQDWCCVKQVKVNPLKNDVKQISITEQLKVLNKLFLIKNFSFIQSILKGPNEQELTQWYRGFNIQLCKDSSLYIHCDDKNLLNNFRFLLMLPNKFFINIWQTSPKLQKLFKLQNSEEYHSFLSHVLSHDSEDNDIRAFISFYIEGTSDIDLLEKELNKLWSEKILKETADCRIKIEILQARIKVLRPEPTASTVTVEQVPVINPETATPPILSPVLTTAPAALVSIPIEPIPSQIPAMPEQPPVTQRISISSLLNTPETSQPNALSTPTLFSIAIPTLTSVPENNPSSRKRHRVTRETVDIVPIASPPSIPASVTAEVVQSITAPSNAPNSMPAILSIASTDTETNMLNHLTQEIIDNGSRQ